MKDILGLIEGFAQLPEIGGGAPSMLLVGSGELEPEARRRVKELGLKDRVEFAGWMAPEEIGPAIEACRIGVIAMKLHKYTHHGSTNKIYHYMMCGKPILTSPVRLTADQVRNDDVGEVSSLRGGDFVGAVQTLLEKERWERCSANGRRLATTKYRWEEDADRLREVYR